ncbi:MAG: class I adenylate-forming enzyme family protein [Xanthomonadales bacterium]|nr:class I adenylate-forming enzyme family protein [Xanthomonadales bacterium]
MKLASPEKIARYRELGHWQDKSLYQMFADVAAAAPDQEALVDPINRAEVDGAEMQRLSWAECRLRADAMAAGLLQHGVRPGDIVLVQAPNISELVLFYLACARIGAVVSPAPVQYGAHELNGIIDSLGPRACCGVALADGNPVAALSVAAERGIDGFTLGQLNADPHSEELAGTAHPDADDCFTICWTSGTTGTPKGVPRSHNHWFAQGPAMYHGLGMGTGDRMLSPFPFINMAAIGGSLMGWLMGGGTLILHHPFDLAVFLRQVAQEKPNVTLLPPAVLNLLLKDPKLSAMVDFSGLSAVGSGSAPLSPWMVREWQERGVPVVNIFGSNEGAALLTSPTDVPDPEIRATSFPRFGQVEGQWTNPISQVMETRLVAPATGETVTGPGEVGELYIRGPNVFEGYWRMTEEESRELGLFDPDGYFRTGDLFEIAADDPSLMRFVARAKDIIIRGGMNVSMEEVDGLLADHPDLVEAATFPVADEILGERIGVAVVPRPGQTPDLDAITDHLKTKGLAVFKLPEVMVVKSTLPRNAMNKVLRHLLAEETD